MRNRLEITKAFESQPVDEVQRVKIHKVTLAFTELALEVESLVPDSADRTAAFRDLLKAKFQCVQAISHPVKNPSVRTEVKGEFVTPPATGPTLAEIEQTVQVIVDANQKAHADLINNQNKNIEDMLNKHTSQFHSDSSKATPANEVPEKVTPPATGRKGQGAKAPPTPPETPAAPAAPEKPANDDALDF